MPAFEVFTKRMVPLTKAPFITIQRRGTMSLNRSAFVALGSPEAVELLYDATDRIIGIREVDESAEHAYAIRETNNSGSFILSGTAFLNYYGIKTEESVRYSTKVVDGILCIDLKVPGTVVTTKRRTPEAMRNSAAHNGDAGNTIGLESHSTDSDLGGTYKDEEPLR